MVDLFMLSQIHISANRVAKFSSFALFGRVFAENRT